MSVNWNICIQQLLSKKPDEVNNTDYVYYNQSWKDISMTENPFKICLYSNPKGKLKKLYKEYYNIEAWSSFRDKEQVTISMIGQPKVGSNAKQKHCMIYLLINHLEKEITLHFRNSDFFKKFLVDIFFVKDLISHYGLDDYKLNVEFEKLTLRLPFAYIYLNYIYNKTQDIEKVKELLTESLFQDFVKYYKKNEDKNKNWKSLERCNRYMKNTEVYPIVESYIKELV